MKLLACAIVVNLCLPGLALAGATDWQDVAPDTRMRMISSDRLEGGVTLVALEVEMPQSTKTYWRVPGETGIPTQIDTSQSKSISGAEIQWPVPMRDTKDGYLDYVYYGHLVLPLSLEVDGDKAEVQAKVTMGVCDEICVPVQAQFQMSLSFEQPDTGQIFRIRQAMSSVPVKWHDGEPPVSALKLDRAQDAVVAQWDGDAVDLASVLLDNGDAALIFNEAQMGLGNALVLQPLGTVDWNKMVGTPFTLTYRTQKGLFEQELVLAE